MLWTNSLEENKHIDFLVKVVTAATCGSSF